MNRVSIFLYLLLCLSCKANEELRKTPLSEKQEALKRSLECEKELVKHSSLVTHTFIKRAYCCIDLSLIAEELAKNGIPVVARSAATTEGFYTQFKNKNVDIKTRTKNWYLVSLAEKAKKYANKCDQIDTEEFDPFGNQFHKSMHMSFQYGIPLGKKLHNAELLWAKGTSSSGQEHIVTECDRAWLKDLSTIYSDWMQAEMLMKNQLYNTLTGTSLFTSQDITLMKNLIEECALFIKYEKVYRGRVKHKFKRLYSKTAQMILSVATIEEGLKELNNVSETSDLTHFTDNGTSVSVDDTSITRAKKAEERGIVPLSKIQKRVIKKLKCHIAPWLGAKEAISISELDNDGTYISINEHGVLYLLFNLTGGYVLPADGEIVKRHDRVTRWMGNAMHNKSLRTIQDPTERKRLIEVHQVPWFLNLFYCWGTGSTFIDKNDLYVPRTYHLLYNSTNNHYYSVESGYLEVPPKANPYCYHQVKEMIPHGQLKAWVKRHASENQILKLQNLKLLQ